MQQGLLHLPNAQQGRFVPTRPLRARRGAKFGLSDVLVVMALSGLGATLHAQSRGSLQVATQVLEAGPSEQALAQGLALLQAQSAPANPTLASIQVSEAAVGDAEPTRLANPAPTVVTISFLRN